MGKTRDLFKKIRDTKGNFQKFSLQKLCKKVHNAGQNGMDLTEAEDIKKMRQEYTELYKKDLYSPDNHHGMITQLKPDILECKVKWALGSITMNKVHGGDAIPVEQFQILKDAEKVLYLICQKFGKVSNDHRTGKGQFSFQSQRMLKLSHNCTHLPR